MPQAIILLTLGPLHALVQNQVYALPGRASYIFSDAALQISNDSAFGASQAVTANTPTVAAGSYVRCAVSAANVKLAVI